MWVQWQSVSCLSQEPFRHCPVGVADGSKISSQRSPKSPCRIKHKSKPPGTYAVISPTPMCLICSCIYTLGSCTSRIHYLVLMFGDLCHKLTLTLGHMLFKWSINHEKLININFYFEITNRCFNSFMQLIRLFSYPAQAVTDITFILITLWF